MSLMFIGYYAFLGSGDYHLPSLATKEWMFTWGLSEWKKFVDDLLRLDVNTLMIYLNGHKLPYHSVNYSDLIDQNHPNNKTEFLSELLMYLKEKRIRVIAVLTTTGHAGGFLDAHPEIGIEPSRSDVNIEDTLVSFPDHMRKAKLSKKSGAAQLGLGVMCHNKVLPRLYAENIIKELIDLYGEYFDGVALHPPESAYPCSCESCAELFFSATRTLLRDATDATAKKFFISSYLKFQDQSLFSLIRDRLPRCDLLTFSIPWLFEIEFNTISDHISRNVSIIEWDYNLSDQRIASLQARLNHYMELGYSVYFMPTAGFSFDIQKSLDKQVNAVHTQLRIAEELDVAGVVHFLGPKLSEHILETSRKTAIDSASRSSNCI